MVRRKAVKVEFHVWVCNERSSKSQLLCACEPEDRVLVELSAIDFCSLR